jgi:hypothetical protein
MSAWDHLPNAKLIDQVLADLRANPEVFSKAWGRRAARVAVWDQAWNAVRDQAGDQYQAWNQAWTVSASGRVRPRGMVYPRIWGRAWTLARGVFFALITYDDSAKYLDMSYKKLKVWAELSEHPAAVILLPYVKIKEQLKEPA